MWLNVNVCSFWEADRWVCARNLALAITKLECRQESETIGERITKNTGKA